MTITQIVSPVLVSAVLMASGGLIALVTYLRKKRFSVWSVFGILVLSLGLFIFIAWA